MFERLHFNEVTLQHSCKNVQPTVGTKRLNKYFKVRKIS